MQEDNKIRLKQEMLAIIRRRILRLQVCYPKIYKLRKFCPLFCTAVKIGHSRRGRNLRVGCG